LLPKQENEDLKGLVRDNVQFPATFCLAVANTPGRGQHAGGLGNQPCGSGGASASFGVESDLGLDGDDARPGFLGGFSAVDGGQQPAAGGIR
jgi:hypothetical protein